MVISLVQPTSSVAQAVSRAVPTMTCSGLAGFSASNVQVLTPTYHPASGTLPAYCNVVGVIDSRVSTQDPDHFTYGIVFELNLPDTWSGNFELMGGGGLDGSVSNPVGFFGQELAQGWAVASDDGGHENSAGGFPPYTPPPGVTWSDQDDSAGGVAHFGIDENLPKAAIAEAWNEQTLVPLTTTVDANGQPYLPSTFTNADLSVTSAAILSVCDALDGLVDGIVDDFTNCTDRRVYPALTQFTCSPNGAHGNIPHGGSCLTAEQVSALKRIFAGPHDSAGRALYSGWYWDAGIWNPPAEGVALGWQAWNVSFLGNPAYNTAANLTLGAAAVPMVFTTPPVPLSVNGPNGQEAFIFSYNFDQDAPKIFARTGDYPLSAMQFMAANSTNLNAFRRRGGKLIIYSSVNDGIFSGVDIVKWYQQLADEDRHAAQFARLFMVPNMAHCGGGPGTTSFAANMMTAITRWVEKDVPPERIVASNTDPIAPFPSGGLFDPRVAENFPTGGTRPLCAFPGQARYLGTGSTNEASSFVCVAPMRGESRE